MFNIEAGRFCAKGGRSLPFDHVHSDAPQDGEMLGASTGTGIGIGTHAAVVLSKAHIQEPVTAVFN